MQGTEALPALFILIGLLLFLVWRRKSREVRDFYEIKGVKPAVCSYKIVGTARRQRALSKLVGGKTEDGVEMPVRVCLSYENNNRHDPFAVAAMIDNEHIGYLSADDSEFYRETYEDNLEYDGLIIGGWRRGSDDEGSFGVRIDLDL